MKPFGSVPIAPQITTEISNSGDFSVHVVNIISGEVGTNVLKRDSNRKLPANSLYLPLAEEFVAHVRRTPGSCFQLPRYRSDSDFLQYSQKPQRRIDTPLQSWRKSRKRHRVHGFGMVIRLSQYAGAILFYHGLSGLVQAWPQ